MSYQKATIRACAMDVVDACCRTYIDGSSWEIEISNDHWYLGPVRMECPPLYLQME